MIETPSHVGPTGIDTFDVPVDGLTVRVHTAGDRGDPPILWLHGSGPGVSALSNWRALMSTMPGYFHLAPDVPGFGASTYPDPAPRGIEASAAFRAGALLALLRELGVERTHVVGNSMGGMITVRLLQAAPATFDRVILMGSGGAPLPPTDDLISMITFYDDPTPARMTDLIGRFVHDTALFGDTVEEIAADRVAVATRPEVRRAHLATFAPDAPPPVFTPDELAAITHEVLVVHGREDRMIPVAASHYLSAHLPNAQLHVLPHAGHWVQIEQVDRFRAQAATFFTES
nr:alpha/beta fold hydrolase [Propionibacterium sp.]